MITCRHRRLASQFVTLVKQRSLSSFEGNKSSVMEWRKFELDRLESRVTMEKENKDETTTTIDDNDEMNIQPMWKDMERRVTRRKPMTITEAKEKGKSIGRTNVRRTDEDTWLQAGLYDGKDV
jgi:hypothetical protein